VNEHQLRRLLRRMILLSAPLPLAMWGAACGGSSMVNSGDAAGAGGRESGGSAGALPHAGAGGASAAGAGGATAGAGGASAGAGGASAGAGGASAGAGGASAGAGGDSAGMGGAGPNDCKGTTQLGCAPGTAIVAKPCVDASMASVGVMLPNETCKLICNAPYVFSCSISAVDATSISVLCNPGCAVGRRPAGLHDLSGVESCELGGYFAQIAHLEAASVTAFRVLRDELHAKGAPRKLVRAAARAARDEIRHTRATSALARRFGAAPRLPRIEAAAPRSLEAMALENAVEGCVRETFGALIATRQAELSRDPLVRAAMKRIARDETQHAALSWRVGRWLETRLDPAARRNVEQAKRAAARELLSSVASAPAYGFGDSIGLPLPAEAAQLAAAMAQTLWS